MQAVRPREGRPLDGHLRKDLLPGGAYPNYFGDVQLFKMQLKKITQGDDAVEYTMPPQATVPKGPKEKVDLSWFKRRMRWR
jgi:hypothetical protein